MDEKISKIWVVLCGCWPFQYQASKFHLCIVSSYGRNLFDCTSVLKALCTSKDPLLFFFFDPSLPSSQALLCPPSSRKPSLTSDPPSPCQPLYKPPCRDWLLSAELFPFLSIAPPSVKITPAQIRPGPQEKDSALHHILSG